MSWVAAFNRRWNERYVATFFLCLGMNSLFVPDHPLRVLVSAVIGFVIHGLVCEFARWFESRIDIA